jgi:RNA polymerase sigma-70 factor (ECF subfamily)
MAAGSAHVGSDPEAFVEFCAGALPEVYGYLLARCGDRPTAEDLTSETFVAAVDAIRRTRVVDMTTGWLIVVARRRLVDYWRRQEREGRHLTRIAYDGLDHGMDTWESPFDVEVGLAALQRLGPHHRAALTLRYLDGLPVAEVARQLDRGLHATEALLQRARRALRCAYEEVEANA